MTTEHSKYDPHEFDAEFSKAYRAELDAIGKLNLVILGDVGAGKSTLVNKVFGFDEAPTGVGAAVTKELRWYEDPKVGCLRICDNPGFEFGDSVGALVAALRSEVETRRSGDPTEHVHAVWLVVKPGRLLEAHKQVVSALAEMGLKPMLVITHVDMWNGEYDEEAVTFAKKVEEMDLPLNPHGRIFLVNSVARQRPPVPQHGLKELVHATIKAVPTVARRAVRVAQIVDVREKRKDAFQHLRKALPFAAAAGALPLPLADMAALTAVHAKLLAEIAADYGVALSSTQTTKLAGAIAFTGGSISRAGGEATRWALEKGAETAARRAARHVAGEVGENAARIAAKQLGRQTGRLAGAFARIAPGIGLAVAAVNATLAVGFTYAVGHAWMKACEEIRRKPDLFHNLAILDIAGLFSAHYQRHKSEPPTEDLDAILTEDDLDEDDGRS